MNRERSERGKKKRKIGVLGIKNHRSAAVRGGRARCAPPGSASADRGCSKSVLSDLANMRGALIFLKPGENTIVIYAVYV